MLDLSELMAQRFAWCAEVAAIKYRDGLSVFDANREASLLAKLDDVDATPVIRDLYLRLLKTSRLYQERLMKVWDQTGEAQVPRYDLLECRAAITAIDAQLLSHLEQPESLAILLNGQWADGELLRQSWFASEVVHDS